MAAAIILDDITYNMNLYHNSLGNDMAGVVPFLAEEWDFVPSPHNEASGVLLDYACGSPADQLFSQSPTGDLLQDSIWLETSNDIGPPADWFNDINVKHRHPSSDDALQKLVSPQELILRYDSLARTADEFSQLDDIDLDVVESETLSENLHSLPVVVVDDSSSFLESSSSVDALSEDGSRSRAGDSSQSSNRASHSSHHNHVLTNSLLSSSDVSVLQEVPTSPLLSPDYIDFTQYLYDVDCESLGDPESVFRILRGLHPAPLVDVLTTHPSLSSVSPEEVDSILSDGMESFEEPVNLPPVSVVQFSTMSEEYLQQVASPSSYESSAESVDGSSVAEEYHQQPFTPKSESHSRSSLPRPYSSAAPVSSRREKKKEQNKTAAVRYRKKKQQEKVVVLSEVDKLELRNNELKAKVDDLNREISYLRALIEEINKQ